LVDASAAQRGDIQNHIYDGATHGFDDPSSKRQDNDANAAATRDAIARAQRFFARELAGKPKP
jgi:dienelactone hydrolase